MTKAIPRVTVEDIMAALERIRLPFEPVTDSDTTCNFAVSMSEGRVAHVILDPDFDWCVVLVNRFALTGVIADVFSGLARERQLKIESRVKTALLTKGASFSFGSSQDDGNRLIFESIHHAAVGPDLAATIFDGLKFVMDSALLWQSVIEEEAADELVSASRARQEKQV